MMDWRRNVRWGLGWGLGFAMVYAVAAIAISAATGGRALRMMGTTIGKVALWYVCAGILVGLTIGLLRPLAMKNRISAALVGVIAALPGMWLMSVGLFGEPPGSGASNFVTVVGALLLGGGFGYQSWEERS